MRVHPALIMPNFYSMINARFNERRTDANRGDILSSHDKNQIHVHNHARVHTVSYVSVIIEPFWSFCVINMPKRLFFESLDPSMMKPYTTLTNFRTKYLVMCKVYTDVCGIK